MRGKKKKEKINNNQCICISCFPDSSGSTWGQGLKPSWVSSSISYLRTDLRISYPCLLIVWKQYVGLDPRSFYLMLSPVTPKGYLQAYLNALHPPETERGFGLVVTESWFTALVLGRGCKVLKPHECQAAWEYSDSSFLPISRILKIDASHTRDSRESKKRAVETEHSNTLTLQITPSGTILCSHGVNPGYFFQSNYSRITPCIDKSLAQVQNTLDQKRGENTPEMCI